MMKLVLSLAACATLVSSAAQAATRSVLINKAPARHFIESKLNKSKTGLRLSNKLDKADLSRKGVWKNAAKKATQAINGSHGFSNGKGGGNYVVTMGGQKMIVTVVHDTNWFGSDGKTKIERFTMRNAKSGIVAARGFIGNKKITWTRMKNEHAKSTPAERNAAP